MTDRDIPSLIEKLEDVEVQLRDHFKATEVNVNVHDGSRTVRLEFRGFESLEAALEKTGDVARRLNNLPETEDVDTGVSTTGVYRPHDEETDDRPSGWVSAEFE